MAMLTARPMACRDVRDTLLALARMHPEGMLVVKATAPAETHAATGELVTDGLLLPVRLPGFEGDFLYQITDRALLGAYGKPSGLSEQEARVITLSAFILAVLAVALAFAICTLQGVPAPG